MEPDGMLLSVAPLHKGSRHYKKSLRTVTMQGSGAPQGLARLAATTKNDVIRTTHSY